MTSIPANSLLSVEFSDFELKPLKKKKAKKKSNNNWTHKLVIGGDEENCTWFSNRPIRNKGSFSFDEIVGKSNWSSLFSNNPNAVLTGNNNEFIFETSLFRRRKNGKYVARVKSLKPQDDPITGRWPDSSLIIDSTVSGPTGWQIAEQDGQEGAGYVGDIANLAMLAHAGKLLVNRLTTKIEDEMYENNPDLLDEFVDVTRGVREDGSFNESVEYFVKQFTENPDDVSIELNDSMRSLFKEGSSDFFNSLYEEPNEEASEFISNFIEDDLSSIDTLNDITVEYCDYFDVSAKSVGLDGADDFWDTFTVNIRIYGDSETLDQLETFIKSSTYQNYYRQPISDLQAGTIEDDGLETLLDGIFDAVGGEGTSFELVADLSGGEEVVEILTITLVFPLVP